MPHAGLMDESVLGPVEGPLQRAKLHVRGGRRRLSQGKVSAGIVTLYDALGAAMSWYVAFPGNKSSLSIREDDDITNDNNLFEILKRSGVIDNSFDYEAFDLLVEKALHTEMPEYDYAELLKGIESVMTQLGVMPFEEKELPPEDPSIF